MNALGIYLLSSMVFVVFAMIEFAIVLLWSRACTSSEKSGDCKGIPFIERVKNKFDLISLDEDASTSKYFFCRFSISNNEKTFMVIVFLIIA